MARGKSSIKKSVAKLRFTLFGVVLIVSGLLLATYSYGTLSYLRGQLADKNQDGIVDWHDADVNNDGVIELLDTLLVVNNSHKTSASPDWLTIVSGTSASRCDLNGDGVVDEADVAVLSIYFGFGGTLSLIGALTNTGSVYGQEFLLGIGLFFAGLAAMAYSRFFFKRRR